MNRLQAQYQRLYLPLTAEALGTATVHSSHPGPASAGTVRALVLALGSPADWDALAPLWRGVQTELDWPAPAIAVNGRDAFQLWFSLAEPVPRAEAALLLVQLQRRYLADVRPDRVRAWPGADAATESPACPPMATAPDRWAAFVTPDLPAVFGDDPALDFPPSEDAQAELLSRLGSIQPHAWQDAAVQLAAALAVSPAVVGVAPAAPAAAPATPTLNHAALVGPYEDPRLFLRDVMNDSSVALLLRVDAAKALLS